MVGRLANLFCYQRGGHVRPAPPMLTQISSISGCSVTHVLPSLPHYSKVGGRGGGKRLFSLCAMQPVALYTKHVECAYENSG
jgi:hypothetical protein